MTANIGKVRRPTGKSTKIPTGKESKREIHPNTNRERNQEGNPPLYFLIVDIRHAWLISWEFERITKHQLLKGSKRGNRINNSDRACSGLGRQPNPDREDKSSERGTQQKEETKYTERESKLTVN